MAFGQPKERLEAGRRALQEARAEADIRETTARLAGEPEALRAQVETLSSRLQPGGSVSRGGAAG
ncbi:MAG: hypothetical protein OXN89_20295 [Bryobacterales bacterium]|nr:hypothetical protein [Bryobacterales bacterium]